MTHRFSLPALLLLAALALPACGGAETPEAAGEPGAARPAAEPGSPAPGVGAADPAAEELDAPALGGDAPVASTDPATGAPAVPAAPGGPAQPAAPGSSAGAGSPPVPAPSAALSDAEQILARAERVYADVRSMEADFVQNLSVPLLGSNQQSRGRFYQRRPDRLLLRFTDPEGDILVADGRYFWMYYPSSDRTQVMRAAMSQGTGQVDLHREFLSNPNQRFDATLDGVERVDGRAAHVLTLVPRQRAGYRQVRIWVDQQDHLVRRFELTEENESVRRFELRNLRLNPNLSDSLFQFTPPPGTQVFDQ